MTARGLTPPRLTDGVVTLRLAGPQDIAPLTAGLSQESTVEWLMSVPHPYDHQESVRWVEEVTPAGWRDGTLLFLSIADADDDAFLGEVGLTHVELDAGRVEVAYWLAPHARGRGVMTRALRLLLAWAFEELGVVRVDWAARADNDASRAVAEAVGFRLEGVRRGRFLRRYDGARYDEQVAGLLRDDLVDGSRARGRVAGRTGTGQGGAFATYEEDPVSEHQDWNQAIIAEFRANEGRVGGQFEGAPMVLMHHVGRRSGKESINPVMYLADDGDPTTIYVFASKAGAPTHPDWYWNMTQAGRATVEVGTETYDVTVRELEGEEPDRVYAEQASRYPGFAEYEERTAGIRVIPVLALTRA